MELPNGRKSQDLTAGIGRRQREQTDRSRFHGKLHSPVARQGSFPGKIQSEPLPCRFHLDQPMAPFIYAVSTLHCMSVSLGLEGAGLGAAWGEELALEMLAEAGFRRVEVKQVEGDVTNNYYIARKA